MASLFSPGGCCLLSTDALNKVAKWTAVPLQFSHMSNDMACPNHTCQGCNPVISEHAEIFYWINENSDLLAVDKKPGDKRSFWDLAFWDRLYWMTFNLIADKTFHIKTEMSTSRMPWGGQQNKQNSPPEGIHLIVVEIFQSWPKHKQSHAGLPRATLLACLIKIQLSRCDLNCDNVPKEIIKKKLPSPQIYSAFKTHKKPRLFSLPSLLSVTLMRDSSNTPVPLFWCIVSLPFWAFTLNFQTHSSRTITRLISG